MGAKSAACEAPHLLVPASQVVCGNCSYSAQQATKGVVRACAPLAPASLSPRRAVPWCGPLFLLCSMLKDLKDMETLSELGVLFLLYEQGLELSLDRLKVRAQGALQGASAAAAAGVLRFSGSS